MQNKKHHILDDAWDMKESEMGGAEHTLRVGLITNTVIAAMPIVIDDYKKLVVEKPKFTAESIKDQPVLLHVSSPELTVAVLVVLDKDSGNIQCYPFNNLNEDRKWWVYEMAFDLVKNGHIEIRPVHPLVPHFDPDKNMMSHLETLAVIVSSFLHRIDNDEITVYEVEEDLSRINKKRRANKYEPITNDWKINYVERSITQD